MSIIQIDAARPTIESETIFSIWKFPVTNSILMAVLITLIILVFSYLIYKKAKLVPQKWQIAYEWLYEAISGLIDQLTGDRAITQKIFYLIAGLFIFLGLSNLLGYL